MVDRSVSTPNRVEPLMSTCLQQVFHLSFEFFPPATAIGQTNLAKAAKTLQRFGPEFFSVTYGAGGSTKTRTNETVAGLISEGCTTVPHLSWGDSPREHLVAQLRDYQGTGSFWTRIASRRYAIRDCRSDSSSRGGTRDVWFVPILVTNLRFL